MSWFAVDRSAVASKRLIPAAKDNNLVLVCILSQRHKVVGASTLRNRSGKLEFDGLFDADFAKSLQKGFEAAEKWSATKAPRAEVRVLGAPSANFLSVWLHSEKDNVFFPLPPSFGRFVDYNSYSEEEICAVLKPDAKIPGLK